MAVDAQAWSKCFVVVVGFALSPINHFPHSPLGQPLVVSLKRLKVKGMFIVEGALS